MWNVKCKGLSSRGLSMIRNVCKRYIISDITFAYTEKCVFRKYFTGISMLVLLLLGIYTTYIGAM